MKTRESYQQPPQKKPQFNNQSIFGNPLMQQQQRQQQQMQQQQMQQQQMQQQQMQQQQMQQQQRQQQQRQQQMQKQDYGKTKNAFQRVDFENVQKIKKPENVQDILSRLHARAQEGNDAVGIGTTTQEESSSNNDRILEDSTLTEDTQGNKVKRRGRKKKTLMTIM